MLLVSHNTAASEATSMTDVTSPCLSEVLPEVLSDPAAALFGLEDEFTVLQVERMTQNAIKVLVELTAREGPCRRAACCRRR
jgi:hypothetical protein